MHVKEMACGMRADRNTTSSVSPFPTHHPLRINESELDSYVTHFGHRTEEFKRELKNISCVHC